MTIRKFIFHGYQSSGAHDRLRKLSLTCLAVLAAQVLPGIAGAQPAPPRSGTPQLAPVQNENSASRIPGQYLVVFKPGTARNVVAAAQERVKGLGGTVMHSYSSSAVTGFSVKLPTEGDRSQRAMETLRAIPGVAYIEADQKYTFDTMQPPNPPVAPPTGLDRVDRRLLPLDNLYTYSETGAGVHVYVIDSGIWTPHPDFGGRAIGAFSVVASLTDCLGHGTHVAGTIGGTTFGVAKQVTLHSVRVGDASCAPTTAGIVAGMTWVTNNRNPAVPNVANMSIGGPISATIDAAVTGLIAAGVTYVVSAGNSNADACGVSPAHMAAAITVGAADPTNDQRASFSNFGTCVDLFAPGVNIVSTMPDTLPVIPGCTIISNTPGSRTQSCSGTSMASPHVAGVAARHLQNNPADSPAAVWNRINAVADVFGTTAGWAGVGNPGAGSPNELLHWGSVSDGQTDGDPHFVTVEGIPYDFQGAGEFTVLRDGNGLEIQTRQSPVTTQPPIANAYTGLATCVSLNTAVAARVGKRRVTYEPNFDRPGDPNGPQLRIDGVLTTLGPLGIDLGQGGRVTKSPIQPGIEIDFADGTSMTAVSYQWGPPHNRPFLNVSVSHTTATQGIMGALASGSWLPALPDGSSLGPKPAALPQRYSDLYGKFANGWRVTNTTSLFDYAPGTSTATFTAASWPPENPPCVVPESPAAKPVDQKIAERLCREVTDKNSNANCVFDVGITGEPGFAKLYLTSQQIKAGGTRTTLTDNKDRTLLGEQVIFVATVALKASGSKGVPAGSVQFTLDGEKTGEPVKLDRRGQATWKTSRLEVGDHKVAAIYIPAKDSVFLTSSSAENPHAVVKEARQQ
jgi:subtilisin family serine protease